MAWEDFSDYVTHFTKASPPRSDYESAISIYGSCHLIAGNAFGIGRNRAPVGALQKVVCFSEVPLHCLSRIASRRSRFGIGFKKEFVRAKGANPIWYVEMGSAQHDALEELMSSSRNATDPVWKLTPLIDAPGTYPHGRYRFEWEREWRLIGDLRFDVADVAFLILPEEDHYSAREFFENARQENIGPCFDCPYVDANWDLSKVRNAFAFSR